ncbi:MAG: hypothetical protein M3321_01745 [Actinomycetota bacterium]|nr:hypothetical protein [Actinomycetota bacterium]
MASFVAAVTGVAIVSAVAIATRKPAPPVPPGLVASPAEMNPSADTLHQLRRTDASAGIVRRPLVFDGGRIEAGVRAEDGSVCFNVIFADRPNGGACAQDLRGDRIAYNVRSSRGIGTVVAGLVGDEVTGVDIVTADGTVVPALLENNAFFVRVPTGATLQSVRKTLADGSTKVFEAGE